MNILTWIGIIACLSQSAMFSGMNLAVFSLSRLRLEVEAADGNAGRPARPRLKGGSKPGIDHHPVGQCWHQRIVDITI